MSVTAAKGFIASGLACGIKPSGKPDLSMVATANKAAVTAAGVFTSNLLKAGPVQISQQHLSNAKAAAVVLNSGNANAATGEQGREDARRMAELTAKGIGCATEDVLVCSTGLIGIPMNMVPIESGIPQLASQLGGDESDGVNAAEAIMTTDTKRKEAVASFITSDGVEVTVGGMAKGAAMLSPAMATMLCVVTTDANVEAAHLQESLSSGVSSSFDCLIVDGARSTNDTVLILANGEAGNAAMNNADQEQFNKAVAKVCGSLAEQMGRDAEGATKFVRIVVNGARTNNDAKIAARGVANSQLVQCSFYGGDPYWGRILSELGASGAVFDPEQTSISYNGIQVCRNGIECDHDQVAVAKSMENSDIEVVADLFAGIGTATVLTTDLSPAYIAENMRTS